MRVTIETERLILRPVVPDDYEAAFKWCGDPKVNKYMIYPLYTKAEDVRTYFESRNLDDPDTRLRLLISFKILDRVEEKKKTEKRRGNP